MLLCLAFNGAVQAQDNCSADVYAVTNIHLDENATDPFVQFRREEKQRP